MKTLNNKIARAFFALTACMAMAFGFLACSNDSEPPVVIVVPDNQTKNGGTKTDGETNAPVATPAIYTITFNANDGSENPATVPQNFTAGIPQTLTPVEELGFSKEGFNFAGWGTAPKSKQASYADGASYTATAPATLYALWSEIPVYSVNIPVNENGSVTATPATGSAGTEITLLAEPNAGYEFGSFTVTAEDGTDVPVTDNAFTMPDCNVSVSAAFVKIDYSITILGAENGGVSTENATANYGDTVTLTITPDEGYALATLTYALQDEEPVNIGGSGRQRSFAMPLGDVTIAATFTTIAFSVNVADSIEGGTVAATPTNANVGDQIALVPTANAGWRFVSWNAVAEGGTPVTVENNKFTMPAKNVSVSATFEKINYSITVLPSDSGSVTGLPATATVGTEVSLSNTPNAGYKFVSYTVRGADGTAVTVADGKFTMPAKDVTVSAVFNAINYSVNIGTIVNGSVTATPTTATVGTSVVLTISPMSGYQLASLAVTDAGGTPVALNGTDNSRTFTMPASDVIVTAAFSLITYKIDVGEVENGSVVASAAAAAEGADVTLDITPVSGYALAALTVIAADGSLVPFTGTDNAKSFKMPAQNVTVSASFVTAEMLKLYIPLTLEAIEADVQVTFENKARGPVSYRINGGNVQTIARNSAGCISLEKAGDKVSFYGDNETYADKSYVSNIGCTKDCYVYGNIMSFVKRANFATADSVADYAFCKLFYNNTHIRNKVGAELLLPATTLADSCYKDMFSGCTSLAVAPALPATTLARSCYESMFKNCAGLTSAPDLPATTLAGSCYRDMFSGCTSLAVAPALPATTLAGSCYWGMFDGCASLTSAPELPATTLASCCYWSMFSGCASLTVAPELPATTLAEYCYSGMFEGCASLTSAPALPATTLASWCYNSMFRGCTRLTSAPALPATTLAVRCYDSMFYGCTSLTSAPELPATTLAGGCYWGMFDGCTRLTSAPKLPATTLADSCYKDMFSRCTSLASAPELPATTLAGSCYSGMFNDCALTSAPALPVTTLAESCYSRMFCRCASLTVAPELPATTLAKSCYEQMFVGCKSLTVAPELPATTLAESCYREMFSGCVSDMFSGRASLTSAPELPATTLAKSCYERMFSDCRSLTVAPELPAMTLVESCYRDMFNGCASLGSIVCLATNISAADCTKDWLRGVARRGTFIKELGVTIWPEGGGGIPSGWAVKDNNGGSVKVLDNIKNGTVKSDATFYSCGKTVTLTITPESGYKLSSLVVKDEDGKVIETSGTDDSRTFTMPAKNVTVSATFAAIYNINIGTFANGSVEANVTTAIAGTSVTLTVKPNAGYALKTLAYTPQGGSAISVGGSGNTRTFTMPAKNVTVSVTFAAINNVSIGTFAHGSVAASPMSAIVGTSVTLTASPASGYRLDTLTVKDASGVMVSTSGTGDTRTFTMPDANVTVKATFVPITYSVNIGSFNHGTVTASKTSVAGGKSVTLTVKPDAGYRLDTLIVKDANGSTVSTSGSGNTKTFTMPEKNVTVTATFVAINYTVSVSSSEHGTVTADKTSGIYGTSVALTINPDSGYKLYVLTVKGTDGSAVSTSGIGDTRTFKIPIADVTVFAAFVPLAAFSTGAYTALPAGVDGSAGTSGTYVTYGLYPQTIIDKSVAINWEEEKTIGTFSCYKGSDGEWYSDVYKDGNVSWFKMEPIKWRVLTKNYNGKKLLLAENILTGCDYYDGDTSATRKVYNKGELTLVYANNYNESRIKAYLCGCGYYDGKKEVSPGGGSTTDHFNVEFQGKGFKTEASLDTGYVSDIFLLSSGEVSSSEYGFNSTVRAKVVRTDYAMAKGGASWWWLRTPYTSMPNNDCVKVVEDDGDIGWMSVGYSFGVVPAICVDR